MRFKDLGKTILAIVGAVGGAYTVSQTVTVAPAFAQEAPRTEQEELEARIEQLMQRGSVAEILREEFEAGTIKQVTYDARARRTNFHDLVYQENVAREQRLPVVMFVVDNATDATRDRGNLSQNRLSVVFKEFRRIYSAEELVFIMYDIRTSPEYRVIQTGPETGTFYPGEEIKQEGLKAVPSLFMYNYFDLAQGENTQKNNGRIKQVDILRGGPLRDTQITQWLHDFPEWWISPNLFMEFGVASEGQLYRFMNTGDFKQVQDFVFRSQR